MSETTGNKIYTAIGLMSGTSLDGIDIACLRTDGQNHVEPVSNAYMPYQPDLKEKIRALFWQNVAGCGYADGRA